MAFSVAPCVGRLPKPPGRNGSDSDAAPEGGLDDREAYPKRPPNALRALCSGLGAGSGGAAGTGMLGGGGAVELRRDGKPLMVAS